MQRYTRSDVPGLDAQIGSVTQRSMFLHVQGARSIYSLCIFFFPFFFSFFPFLCMVRKTRNGSLKKIINKIGTYMRLNEEIERKVAHKFTGTRFFDGNAMFNERKGV